MRLLGFVVGVMIIIAGIVGAAVFVAATGEKHDE